MEVARALDEQGVRALHSSQITPGLIRGRHLFDKAVVFGDGDRPTDDSTGVKVHFDVGTGVLSMYDGSAWLETTLT